MISAPLSPLSLLLGLLTAAMDPQVAFQEALKTRAQGDLAQAELQLRGVCEAVPGWALPWIELAEVQLARGSLGQALAGISQAAVFDAANPRVYHDRALIERAQGRADLAERDEAFAVKLRPEYAEAEANLAELYWAAGKRQQALELLARLWAAHPDQVVYAARLIDAYGELGQQVAAERELRLLIAREPQSAVWHRKLARLLGAQGLKDEAAHENALAEALGRPAAEPRKLRSLPKSKH